jgi:hypothetical protein
VAAGWPMEMAFTKHHRVPFDLQGEPFDLLSISLIHHREPLLVSISIDRFHQPS